MYCGNNSQITLLGDSIVRGALFSTFHKDRNFMSTKSYSNYHILVFDIIECFWSVVFSWGPSTSVEMRAWC